MKWEIINKKVVSNKETGLTTEDIYPSGITIQFNHEAVDVATALNVPRERCQEIVNNLNKMHRNKIAKLQAGIEVQKTHEIEIAAKITNNHAEYTFALYVLYN